MYDIHSPHTRGDRRGERWRLRRGISIHSCEGRQQQNAEGAVEQEFQSAPLMRGETVGDVEHAHRVAISIHSPHARGDTLTRVTDPQSANFNPLPSCEGRHRRTRLSFSSSTFQSTPLIRGETYKASVQTSAEPDFNPLPSCEGRLAKSGFNYVATSFQSTPLTRGETPPDAAGLLRHPISIHSPHTRGDLSDNGMRSLIGHCNPLPSHEGRQTGIIMIAALKNFNPLPSHEGRPGSSAQIQLMQQFQSTPLTRGETV